MSEHTGSGEMIHRELELKLEIPGEDIAPAREHPRVAALAAGPERSAELRSVYFDSAELALRRAGMALRVRYDGSVRVQTLKTGEASTGMLAQRVEYEFELDTDTPELRAVPDPALRAQIEEMLEGRALEPVFETRMRRINRPLHEAGSRWNLDIDVGEIRAGQSSLPIHELELELVRGDVDRLFAFAIELCASIPLRIGLESKADRGYALASAGHADPSVTLQPGAPAPGLRKALEQLARRLAPSLANPDAGDPRAVRAALAKLSALVAGPSGVPGNRTPGTPAADLDWITRAVVRAGADSLSCTRLLLELGRRVAQLPSDAEASRDAGPPVAPD